jgi:hypothetical protein
LITSAPGFRQTKGQEKSTAARRSVILFHSLSLRYFEAFKNNALPFEIIQKFSTRLLMEIVLNQIHIRRIKRSIALRILKKLLLQRHSRHTGSHAADRGVKRRIYHAHGAQLTETCCCRGCSVGKLQGDGGYFTGLRYTGGG